MKNTLLFITFIFFTVSSYAKDEITWQKIHWPPLMVLDGNQVKGEYGLLLELLQKNLPEYDHRSPTMPWSRFWHDVKEGKHLCNIMAYKNADREKFTEFTVPFSIFSSNVIIMRKKTLKRLGLVETEAFSLVKLMKMRGVKGLLEKSRSYSAPIDKLLETHESQSSIKRSSIKAASTVPMVLLGRTDYILEYPIVASYIRKKNANKQGELISIQIEEIKPLNWGYVACPKNAWGKRLVGKINNILRREKSTPHYRRIIEMMATNKQEVQLIRDVYDDFIKATE